MSTVSVYFDTFIGIKNVSVYLRPHKNTKNLIYNIYEWTIFSTSFVQKIHLISDICIKSRVHTYTLQFVEAVMKTRLLPLIGYQTSIMITKVS